MAVIQSISVSIILNLMLLSAKPKRSKAEKIICSDTNCAFQCPNNNRCEDGIFICTEMVKTCTLNCNKCNNVTLQSAAQETSVTCSKSDSCHIMDIDITPSFNADDYNEIDRFELFCSATSSSSCSKIDISCDGLNVDNCRCIDYDSNQCVNTNIFGNYTVWTPTTNHPTNPPTNQYTTGFDANDDISSTSTSTSASTSTSTSTSVSTSTSSSTPAATSTSTSTATTDDEDADPVLNTDDNGVKELNSKKKADGSKSTVLGILLGLTLWILLCVAVPLYIKYHRVQKKEIGQAVDEGVIAKKPEYDLACIEDPDHAVQTGNGNGNGNGRRETATEGKQTTAAKTSMDEDCGDALYEGRYRHITGGRGRGRGRVRGGDMAMEIEMHRVRGGDGDGDGDEYGEVSTGPMRVTSMSPYSPNNGKDLDLPNSPCSPISPSLVAIPLPDEIFGSLSAQNALGLYSGFGLPKITPCDDDSDLNEENEDEKDDEYVD